MNNEIEDLEIDELVTELDKENKIEVPEDFEEEELTYEQKCTFAGLLVDGRTTLEAGKEAGIKNPYIALAECSGLIQRFEDIAVSSSKKALLAKREETIAELSKIMRKEKEPVLKLRAAKMLLDAQKSMQKLLESPDEITTDGVVVQLPSQENEE